MLYCNIFFNISIHHTSSITNSYQIPMYLVIIISNITISMWSRLSTISFFYIIILMQLFIIISIFASLPITIPTICNMLSTFVTWSGTPLLRTPVPQGLGEARSQSVRGQTCFIVFHSLKVLIGYWAHLKGIHDDKNRNGACVQIGTGKLDCWCDG